MARLRRSHYPGPGIRRRRHGRGFGYRWDSGDAVRDDAVLERIARLAIPPAWKEVWICPWANGHLQAVGTDAAGRRQYRYHDEWRRRRDAEKFDRMLEFARALPALRDTVAAHLAEEGLGRDRVLAAAVRLIDVGLLRVGGEEYAEEHETYGAATLLREHVRLRRAGTIVVDFTGKAGKPHHLELRDGELAEVLKALKARRTGGPELFAWRECGGVHDVRSEDINQYVKALMGDEFSAKDFRTWSATVLAAAELAGAAGEQPSRGGRRRRASPSLSSRRGAVVSAMRAVADQLGNTPAVCRSSYVDPRVVDRFNAGHTLRLPAGAAVGADRDADALGAAAGSDPWRARRLLEAALLELLEEGGAGRGESVRSAA
ncbi:MAG TPA: DNA topoisomerase IB [Thermoleophilia bacterium]|nr:DNA topoisomerase IB [Thermoleophilia bacterium]